MKTISLLYRKSTSCTHVSGLLHALVAVGPVDFQAPPGASAIAEELLPVTSFACQWKPLRKRKEATLKMVDAKFDKHVYGRQKKR